MTLHLLRTLANASNDVTAELVADAVMLMTKTMPYLVPDALKLLDTRLVRKESTIETRIHDETHLFGPNQKGAFVSGRDELIKSQTCGPTKEPAPGQGDRTTPRPLKERFASVDLTAPPDPASSKASGVTWPATGTAILPSTQQGNRMAQVDIKVIQIADIIGPPERSPFAALVEIGDFTICNSKIMKTAIDFKWQRVRWWVYTVFIYYTASLLVASYAMIGAAWAEQNTADGSLSDAASSGSKPAFILVIVLEVLLFVLEMAQLRAGKLQKWLSFWNVADFASIVFLLTAASGHLVEHQWHDEKRFVALLLNIAGSVGLALKWTGLLSYFDCFQCKSSVCPSGT